MKKALIAILACSAATLVAQEHSHLEQLRDGHIDLLVLYEETEGLHMAIAAGEHDHGNSGEESGHEHGDHEELDHVEIIGGPKAVQITPEGSAWEFLGKSDRFLYVLPQADIHGLPFLGINSEELQPGLFESDPVMTLTTVDGPGDFFLYQVDAFGQPNVIMDSVDPAPDTYILPENTHVHMNWAFSEPGEYKLTFVLEATLTGGTTITSEPQVVMFHIVGQTTYVHEGEADIGLEYDADHGLEFYIAAEEDHAHEGESHEGEAHAGEGHEHGHGAEMHPGDVTFLLGGYSVTEVPDNPNFAFLGDPGSTIYLIGETETEGVPYAGWSTEELDPLLVQGDVTFELHELEGPGDLFLYTVDSFGNVTVIWDSSDPAEDVLTLSLGVHSHYNMAVTAPGTYELEVHGEVTLVAGGTADANAEVMLQAGGLEGYYGHFHRPLPYWMETESAGLLYTEGWPILWSEDLDWFYAWGHGGPDHIYFSLIDEDWAWTSPEIYPYYWSFGSGDWMMW